MMIFKIKIIHLLKIIFAAVFLAAVFTGCGKETDVPEIDLPPTSVLTNQSSWGVVNSTHLRLRDGPAVESAAITTLWKGSVVEIFTKTESPEVIEREQDYWYQVNYGGLTGWVFGAYLDLFASRESAEAYSRELK